MKTKICPICKKEFVLHKNVQKFCSIKCYKKHYKKYMKIYRKNNKNKILKLTKQYHQKHRKERLEYGVLYRKNHKQKRTEYWKQYYQKHKEELFKYRDNYRRNNKKELQKYESNYRKQRKELDINYKLRIVLRSRISQLIKNNIKSISTMKLIGCNIKKLKKHLENQFKKGMTWQNYGRGWNNNGMKEWHIDHIRPCASFDLSKPKEQKKCFNYTNLQPLWAKNNLNKGAKING